MTSSLRDTGSEVGGRAQAAAPQSAVDFDLHGLVGVRLMGASPQDVAAVTRQLGPVQAALEREPEIVIRFVEGLRPSTNVRYLGLGEAAFTDDAFFVLQGAREGRLAAQIPLDQVGGRCEIVCESGLAAVPLLVPILNLTVLAKGWIPLHASAFTYEDTGVLAAGWAKGGKTEALLAFMAHGGRYVGDEWVYVSPDGERLYGLPEPIKIWEWHLPDLPRYRDRLSRSSRARWKAISAAQLVERGLPERLGRGGGGAVGRMMPLLERQLYVHVPPHRLFGASSCPLAGRLDKVLLLASAETSAVRVEPVNPEEIARRMVFSLEHERLKFLSYYLKFRFAFPDAPNPVIEGAADRQREALVSALAGKEAYVVHHPFPAPIPALFEAIRPLLGSVSH